MTERAFFSVFLRSPKIEIKIPMTIRLRVMESPMAEPILAIRVGMTNTRKKDVTPMMRESQLRKPYFFSDGVCVSIMVTSFT